MRSTLVSLGLVASAFALPITGTNEVAATTASDAAPLVHITKAAWKRSEEVADNTAAATTEAHLPAFRVAMTAWKRDDDEVDDDTALPEISILTAWKREDEVADEADAVPDISIKTAWKKRCSILPPATTASRDVKTEGVACPAW